MIDLVNQINIYQPTKPIMGYTSIKAKKDSLKREITTYLDKVETTMRKNPNHVDTAAVRLQLEKFLEADFKLNDSSWSATFGAPKPGQLSKLLSASLEDLVGTNYKNPYSSEQKKSGPKPEI